MPEARADGISIRWADRGAGEPALLLLPGWCSTSTVFGEVRDRCSESYRTLTLDWRGHGGSERPAADFGLDALVDDAHAVIEASGARSVIPVSMADAGWVGIELRRRLGDRVAKLVLVDWLVLEPQRPLLEVLDALKDPARAVETRDRLLRGWLDDVHVPTVRRLVHEDMGAVDPVMWSRAAREVEAAYARERSPLHALDALRPHVPVLHLYGQPEDEAYLAAQIRFAGMHPWFHVRKLVARSHFSTLEVPDQVAHPIVAFAASAPP